MAPRRSTRTRGGRSGTLHASEHLQRLRIPRTYLLPEADGPLPGTDALAQTGVDVVSVAECGHNIMLDNPEGFARATAAALSDHDQQ